MSKLLFDPQRVPVESVAGEPPVTEARLTTAGLRQRFAVPVEWVIEHTDEHLLRAIGRAPTPAAVLLPIIARPQGLTMLLTQRTAHLSAHAGQISFPGGRTDPGDASAIDTALRETQEEIGLDRRHIDILGNLPDYFTGTGYQVTPVVALIAPPFALHAEPFEVAEIFEVPLAFLMNGMHHQRRTIELPEGGGRRTFYAMPYQQHFIWGATAGMLRNLFHFLRA